MKKNILITAHGNSLRALIKTLKTLPQLTLLSWKLQLENQLFILSLIINLKN